MVSNKHGGVVIGAGCINKCLFCDFPFGYRPTEEQTRKEEIGIYKDLISYRKRGYTRLDISGSDPIEYSKIIPLVRYIRRIGFLHVLLSTHGRQLNDKNFASALIDAGIGTFRIPIYGSNAEIHESIMRERGSFDDIIEGIRNIKAINPSVNLILNTLVMEQNKDDLLNILKLAFKFEPYEFGVSVMYVKSEEQYSSYVPLKNLRKYVIPVRDYAVKNNLNVHFYDMPYCIFGSYSEMVNMPKPPDLGQHNQPKGDFKSNIKNLPTYRLKTKAKICECCTLSRQCDGFLINDIKKFGTGNLKPVQ